MHKFRLVALTTLLSTVVLMSGCSLDDLKKSLSPSTSKLPSDRNAPPGVPVALEKPNLSQAGLLVWANEAAVATYNYNFGNYREQLQTASKYFMPDGWKAFETAMKQSGILNQVIKDKLVVRGVATDGPVVKSQSAVHGRYTWVVEMPMLITYESAIRKYSQHVTVQMTIKRADPNTGVRGVAIKSFVVTEQPAAGANPAGSNTAPAS